MSTVTAEFKFEIGDFVRPRSPWTQEEMRRRLHPLYRLDHKEIAFVVVSRWVEECIGGTQLYYTLRHVDSRGSMGIDAIRMGEVELEKFEKLPEEDDGEYEGDAEATTTTSGG